MYTVKIWIVNKTIGGSDLTEHAITSQISMRSAKNKATRWINTGFFSSDIENLKKDYETMCRADWTLTLKNPWA